MTHKRITWWATALTIALLALPAAAQQGARITGTFQGEDGKPLPGIEFRLKGQDAESTSLDGLTSDKKGRITIPNLRAGTYVIEIVSPGLRVARVELEARAPDGQRVAEFAEDVPEGIAPPPFSVTQAQRMEMSVVLAKSSGAASGEQRSLAAAQGESAKLRELNTLFEQGNMPELAQKAQQVVAENPDLGGAWYLLGIGQWKTQRLAEAVASLRKAVELAPDQPGVKAVLGQALLDQGDALQEKGDENGATNAWDEAATLFAAQLAETPKDLAVLNNRIVALDRLARQDELIEAVEALRALDPSNMTAQLRLAELYAEKGDREKALEVLNSIPNPGPEAADHLYNVAVEMYNANQYDSMIIVLQKALSIVPDSPEYHRLLGRAHLGKGDNESALRELKEFLRLAPDDPAAETERTVVDSLEKGAKG